jgi:hypothetical protein
MTAPPTGQLDEELAEAAGRFAGDLHSAAMNFMRVGLSILHEERDGGLPARQQVAVGNLGVAVELFLKAFIAHRQITLVFKSLVLPAPQN